MLISCKGPVYCSVFAQIISTFRPTALETCYFNSLSFLHGLGFCKQSKKAGAAELPILVAAPELAHKPSCVLYTACIFTANKVKIAFCDLDSAD